MLIEAEQRGDMVANRVHVLIEEEHQGDLVSMALFQAGVEM
jgi:hypothetical protein